MFDRRTTGARAASAEHQGKVHRVPKVSSALIAPIGRDYMPRARRPTLHEIHRCRPIEPMPDLTPSTSIWISSFRARGLRGLAVALRPARLDLTRNSGFPDACMSIEHFISKAVKDERTVIQPFQIVDFIGILEGNCASPGPSGDGNHEDRRSSPKL
jgi:hypothetical protein